jgi:hypothetical protein
MKLEWTRAALADLQRILDFVAQANCDLSIGCSLGTYPENWGYETKPTPGAPNEQS